MVKKSVTITLAFIAFIFLITISLMVVAVAQETEMTKITKTYDWLTTKVKTKALWDDLDVQEHAFVLLALKCNETYTEPGNASFFKKAYKGPATIGTCWGEKDVSKRSDKDCRITETALAKLAVDKLELFDTEKVSKWLMNQSSFFEGLFWFLELDIKRDFNASCMISYEGDETTLNINKNKTLTITDAGTCFSVYADYWLKIEKPCYEKSFKISCIVFDEEGKPDENQEFRITLHYKKSDKITDPWFTSAGSQTVRSGKGKWSETIILQSYCLKNPGENNCDYEGTAWATYALKENGEDYNKFIPYLIIEKEDNEKFLPEALLYLAGIDRYGLETEQLQNSPYGFWKAENTKYGQFYDTALAGLALTGTGLGNLSKEKGGARYYLTEDCDRMRTFKETEDKKHRYWKCTESGCEDIRDTAFLLWIFWPEYCPGTALSGCAESGYLCKDACVADDIEIPHLDYTCPYEEVCCKPISIFGCDAVGGVCKTGCDEGEFELEEMICEDSWYTCCKKYSDATCAEAKGEICEENYTCQGEDVETSDTTTTKCCLGICVKEGEYESCYDVPGTSCYDNEICINPDTWGTVPFVENVADGDTRCCPDNGQCILKSCSEANGQECEADETCSISVTETADVKECCTGDCRTKTNEDLCEDLGGEICKENEKCGEWLDKTINCCNYGRCKEKAGLWWLWLLIIVIIAAGVLLYFYKFKPKKKKKLKPPFGMRPIGMPPRRPLPIGMGARPPIGARPMPARKPAQAPARPIPKPIKPATRGKTESELEKTLRKLKGMAKK